MTDIVYSCEIDDPDPADLESRLRPLCKTLHFTAGRYASERSVAVVRSLEDAAWLKTVGGDDIKVERWGIVVGGEEYRHRLDGPAAVLHPTYGAPIETWWLWNQSLGKERHQRAIAAGVAEDRQAFEAWRKETRA